MDVEPLKLPLVSITSPNVNSPHCHIRSDILFFNLLPHFSSRSPWLAPQMHHLHKSQPSMVTPIAGDGGQNSKTSTMKPTTLKPVWRGWPSLIESL